IDDGAVFYLNGQEIYRLAMPTGIITQATFATRTVGDAALEGPFDVPAAGLVRGDNVLAVEVHQANTTSSDIVFGMAADVISTAAASFTPGAPNSVATVLAPFPPVWINEILPNNASGLMDNAGDRDPWIELYNAGPVAVRLDGWALSDDYSLLGKWTFPADTSIPGGGFLLVWADGEPAESVSGALHTTFRLRSPSGSLALSRPQSGTFGVV